MNSSKGRYNMKTYALYDMKEFEQCVIIGDLKEISDFTGNTIDSIRSYLSKKKARPTKLLKHRYELVELEV